MENNLIWIFREPRSGSSWISNALSQKLNKSLYHYEYEDSYSKIDVFDPLKFQRQDTIYTTHMFQLFSKLKTIDPYVIRTTRRNKIEQCLSILYWNSFPDSMKHNYVEKNSDQLIEEKIFNTALINPVTLREHDVVDTIMKIKYRDLLWETSFKDFKTDTIFYEDLVDQVHLPDLAVTLSFNENTNFSQKMPEYKTKVFKNYKQVIDWANYAIKHITLEQYAGNKKSLNNGELMHSLQELQALITQLEGKRSYVARQNKLNRTTS